MVEQSFDMRGALRYAIHAERQAHDFYALWASHASGAAIREKLESLSSWEAEHEKSLVAYYERLFGETPQIEEGLAVDPGLRVQADEFKDYYSLLRIASTAYLSEMRAAELYESMATRAEEDAAKMLLDIAAMERGHMQEALKLYNQLRSEAENPLMF